MKTLKETIKMMKELGLVIDRVLIKDYPSLKRLDWDYEIQFKKEKEQ